jgi:hypothetical protein
MDVTILSANFVFCGAAAEHVNEFKSAQRVEWHSGRPVSFMKIMLRQRNVFPGTVLLGAPSMRRTEINMFKKISVAVLTLGLTLSPMIATAASPAPAPVQDEHKGGERHPHIRAAIRELREARRELETADHDFGGHKKEAIEAVDNAIKQLQQALQYDKK